MKTAPLFLILMLVISAPSFCEPEAVILSGEHALTEEGMKAVSEDRLEDALRAFRQAKKINPHFAPALVGEAQVLTLKNAWDEALSLLNRAVQIAPDFAIAYHNRGILKYYQKKYLEAHADLRKAIELGESVEKEMLFQVWGAAFPGDAVKLMTEQINTEPTNGEAYLNRGIAYFYQEQYQNTLDDWKKSKELGVEPDPVMWQELEKHIQIKKSIPDASN